MAGVGSEEGSQVAEPCVVVPVPVQDSAPEVSQEFAAAEPDVMLPTPVNDAAGIVDGAIGGGRAGQDIEDGDDVTMTGAGPVLPEAISDATELASEQLVPTGATDLGEGGEDRISLLSVDSVYRVHEFSSSASVADQTPDGEAVEDVGAAAAADAQVAGDKVLVTLGGMPADDVQAEYVQADVQVEIEPLVPGEQAAHKQYISASEGLVEEGGVVVQVAAACGGISMDKATVKALVSDGAAAAAAPIATVDGMIEVSVAN